LFEEDTLRVGFRLAKFRGYTTRAWTTINDGDAAL
jgi:hypothetical protein